ncbi:Nuclear import receptor [Allomyces arbusculus]|nr:Nuclear import receptor [Allomyces arbusculus]
MNNDFLNAVGTLYSATQESLRQTAAHWLEQFEASDAAWEVATTTLAAPPTTQGVTFEARVFAAQVIRHKVTRDLYKLAPAQVAQLREAILNILGTTQPAPPSAAVVTQLCCALAEMAIHTTGDWADPVGTVTERFSAREETRLVFLEFLTVLPEELFACENLLTREEWADKFASLIRAHATNLFHSLVSTLQSGQASTSQLKKKLFACVESWMGTKAVPLEAITATPIIPMSFEALQQDDLFDSAVSILSCIWDEAQADITNGSPGGHAIVQASLPFLNQCSQLVQDAEDDEDQAKGMVKLITSAANAMLTPIVTQPDQFGTLITLVLDVSSYPFAEVVTPTFDFWFYLTESLLDGEADPTPFIPVYDKLVTVLTRQVRYPADLDQWTAKDRDDFRELRHGMGDVLKNCSHILGEDRVLGQCLSLMEQWANAPAAHRMWQDAEAILFALRALGAVVHTDEEKVMPLIMRQLPALSALHSKLKYAALLVLSTYTRWTRMHPDMFGLQMELISSGFSDPESCTAAARALKHLAQDCGPQLHPYLQSLHPFYVSSLMTLTSDDAMAVAEAVAFMIAGAPPAEIMQLLNMFATPLVQQLTPSADVPRLRSVLYRLAVFVRVVQPAPEALQAAGLTSYPVLDFVTALWPYLVAVLDKHALDDPVTEGVSKIIRYTLMPNCIAAYTPDLLNRVVSLLVTQYSTTHYSCWLWVSNHVVAQFAKTEQWVAPVLQLIQQLVDITIAFVNKDGFGPAFEAVDETFGLLCTFANTLYPQFVAWLASRPEILQLGVAAVLHIDHPRTMSSLIFFFYEVTRLLGPEPRPSHIPHGIDASPAVQRALLPVAPSLVQVLIQRRVDDAIPSESFNDLTCALRCIGELFPNEFGAWATQALAGMSFLTQAEVQGMVRELQQAVVQNSYSRVRDTINKVVMLHQRRSKRGNAQNDRRRR